MDDLETDGVDLRVVDTRKRHGGCGLAHTSEHVMLENISKIRKSLVMTIQSQIYGGKRAFLHGELSRSTFGGRVRFYAAFSWNPSSVSC